MRNYKTISLLFFIMSLWIIPGCKQIVDTQTKAIEEQGNSVTYGPYEMYIPDPYENREVHQDVQIEVQYPIDWIRIKYTVSNPGDYDAKIELSVEALDFPDLEREDIESKIAPSYSDASGTISDNNSHNLSHLMVDCSDSCDGSTYSQYNVRVWFKAIYGPPGLKVKFEIEVDESNP